MKKRIVLFIALLTLVVGSAYGGEVIITSKTLSVGDVKPFIIKMEGPNVTITEMFGIYQDGKRANVYFNWVAGNKKGMDVYEFIQLNSGKWFCPRKKAYLSK